MVSEYHEQQLRALLEHRPRAPRGLDRGEIDVFDIDELIDRYLGHRAPESAS